MVVFVAHLLGSLGNVDALYFLFIFTRGRHPLSKASNRGEQWPQSKHTVAIPARHSHWERLRCKSDKFVPEVVVKPPIFDKVVEACGYLSGIDGNFGTMRRKQTRNAPQRAVAAMRPGLDACLVRIRPPKKDPPRRMRMQAEANGDGVKTSNATRQPTIIEVNSAPP